MTLRRKLWLHVGLPKTATTAFQSWMRQHSDELSGQSVFYPPLFGANNDKHNFLVGALRQNRNLETVEDVFSQALTGDILLSDEGLSNHLDDFDDDALERFRSLTQDWDVRVLVVTRDENAWIRSYHKQCVLNPNNGASPIWGTAMTVSELSQHDRIRRLMAIENLSSDLAAAFGATEVYRFDFGSENWFENCLKTIGVECESSITLPKTNQSLPDWAIEVLRLVNAETDSRNIRNTWKLALQSYLKTDHTILTNLSQPVQAQIDKDIYDVILNSVETFSTTDQVKASVFLTSLQNSSNPN